STNMAGRGVDIKLGGSDEGRKEEAVDAGGLLVISTYMPESSRIVRQLLGRSGRQGDKGESRRFVALDEPIMEKYKLTSLLPHNHIPEPTSKVIEDKVLLREVERIQRISEGDCFDARARLMKFTMIGEKHREQIFSARARILESGKSELWNGAGNYSEALEKFGEEKLSIIEQKTAVAAINKFWSDYLEYTEEVRRGIHLVEVGGKSPSEEYNITVEEYYQGMENELKEYMCEKLDELISEGEKNYTVDVPKNIHTYLLEDTGEELNKMPLLLNIFEEEEEAKPLPKAQSVLEAPKEKPVKEKKGFWFFKKK
ncbi:MAG: preprotein translocase subunit SecA, partial [Ruminiclostridium sp.]|nr:preprotein translocase subunit SecA [Ruminiclostridium sp.]